MTGGKVLISAVRDEGPFLLEWVAHHLNIGFDRILIAANDCTDGTDEILAALDRAGVVVHLPHRVSPGDQPQAQGYRLLREHCGIDRAEWLAVLDTDEFLNIHTGDHGLDALLAAVPDAADILALNAASFGSAPGHWQPGLVTERFLWRQPTRHRASAAVKSISRRPADYRAIHNHSLVGYRGAKQPLVAMHADGSLHALDGDIPLWRQLRTFPVAAVRHDLAQYNHYAVRTYDSFLIRRERGRGAAPMGQPNDRHTDAYFAERAAAPVEDRSFLRYLPRLCARMADLLDDPAIRAAQTLCESRYALRAARYRDLVPPLP